MRFCERGPGSRDSRMARLTALLAAATAVAAAAGCASTSNSGSSSSSAAASPTGSTAAAVSSSQCGTKPGVKATGTPIPLGAIVTNQPGTSFTDITNMAAAYFACVNANGGINGHPIQYIVKEEQTNPAQIAAEAKQLIESDHVVGIVGNTSLIECSIDHAYWEKNGINVIDAGIASECYTTPNSAAVNMGARYGDDATTQYLLGLHVSKVAFDQSNVPNAAYVAGGPAALAAAAHVQFQASTDNVPITDASSVAIRLVNAAGPNGAIALTFTPPEALKILQAAQKLGLENKVKAWACGAPCNTDFLAQALGPKWEGHFYVNSELAPPDSTNSPTMSLYKAIFKDYGQSVSGGIGNFSQMGFVQAEIMVHALESVTGPYTVAGVNAAIKAVSSFDTGFLCQPWTYGAYPSHIPNNADYMVTPKNGQMVTAQGCTAVSAADPEVAAYRKVAGTAPITK